jgi:tRNA G18 (ribose-2'-O)-methylase SpoU
MAAFAIGVENLKYGCNLGTLMRSAYNLHASMVFTIGRKYHPQASDTVKTFKNIPYVHYDTWEEYRKHGPYSWVPIGVELTESACDVRNFCHPKNCAYILGAEDSGLSKHALVYCSRIVKIPSRLCMNVSATAAIIMYDRLLKSKSEAVA